MVNIVSMNLDHGLQNVLILQINLSFACHTVSLMLSFHRHKIWSGNMTKDPQVIDVA